MEEAIKTFALADFYAYLVVMARLGGLLFFVPGFSEMTTPTRVKALIVVVVAVALTPLLSASIAPMSAHAFEAVWLLGAEALVGYIAALLVRFLFAAIDVAGTLIGYQIGLANAFANSPASAQQSALPGVFLGMCAILFMLLLDMHHVIVQAFVHSYEIFPAGSWTFTRLGEDTLPLLTQGASASFSLGLQMAGPIIITGLFFFAGAGLSNRLAPSIQIFFVTQPLQLFLGFGVLFLTLPMVLTLFAEKLPTFLAPIFDR
ncbi:MAG: flagellar biosynthetic protein FliR [Proteobacteria bacterium]|nr:flagellar biosynthetic protein FliR [Pseudomonadota bacterium]